MSMPSDLDGAVRAAVTRVLADHGYSVTKFVLIADVVSADRVDPALYIGGSCDTPLWDSMGLLSYVAGMDHAEIARRTGNPGSKHPAERSPDG